VINIFLFSFHEQFWLSLAKPHSFLLPTALCLACLVVLKKLSAPRLITCLMVAVCVSALLVVANKDGPYLPLLRIFGVHLPVFALLTLLAPVVLLLAIAFEIISNQKLISANVASLLTLLAVALNIELMNGFSSAIFRVQDYANNTEAASFILGNTSARAMYLALPPLIAGAGQQLLSTHRNWIILWPCLVTAALSAACLCQLYLTRILQNVAMLYFS
jgi:hypothetical protein